MPPMQRNTGYVSPRRLIRAQNGRFLDLPICTDNPIE